MNEYFIIALSVTLVFYAGMSRVSLDSLKHGTKIPQFYAWWIDLLAALVAALLWPLTVLLVSYLTVDDYLNQKTFKKKDKK